MTRHFTAITVGFTAFSTLLFELTQTRILSYVFWNHVVYLTVSLALLGFGISGTLVALLAPTRNLCTPRVLARLLLGFGLSNFGALALTAWLLPHLTWAPGWGPLLFCYVVYVVPFVFAGAILSIILSSSGAALGRLYAIDLLAAGVGCVLFFFLLPLLGAPVLVCVLAAAALVLAAAWTHREDRGVRIASVLGVAALAVVASVQAMQPAFLDFVPVAEKEMGVFLKKQQHPDARIEQTTWTPIGRIDVVSSNTTNLWGYPHPPGSYKILTQDGTAHTRFPSRQLINALEDGVRNGAPPRDAAITAMALQIRRNADVAIVGAGGGIDVANARAFGARSIYAIELNPATYRYAKDVYARYNGSLMRDRRVTLVNGEGRSTLRSLDRQFDVIQVIAIDTFAALSSGAYVLSENYLYTVDAFEDMFDRLAPGGVLAFYRWLFVPPRETLRLSSLACAAWRRRGVTDCDRRIMIVGANDWAMSLFTNGEFTPEEVRTLAAYADSFGNSVLHWPKVFPAAEQRAIEAEYYSRARPEAVQASETFHALTAAYRTGREEEFFRSYQYNVAPTTDDSPFFFEYHPLNAFGMPTFFGGHTGNLRSNNVGVTLFMILAEATVLSLAAILWPLWRYQRSGLRVPHAAAYSVYFAALGFGFMMIEIGVVQKSVLLLGNPLYALPVVLATLLVSAGIGSHVLTARGWTVRQVTGPVALVFLALIVLLIGGLTPLFQSLLHLPFWGRVVATVLTLAPLGVLMGMFFPAGLRAVGREASGFIPWAWGINGCTSVYGSVVAILTAMVFSFNTTVALGAAVYACGFLAARSFSRDQAPAVVTSAPARS